MHTFSLAFTYRSCVHSFRHSANHPINHSQSIIQYWTILYKPFNYAWKQGNWLIWRSWKGHRLCFYDLGVLERQCGICVSRQLWCNQRKFRSQTSDNMDRWKADMVRVREEKRRRKKIKKRKSPKKEDPGARKGRKVAKHCVFPMICGSGGSKSRLAKAAGAEPCGQMRDEKLHVLVARSSSGALLEVEMSKKCTPL